MPQAYMGLGDALLGEGKFQEARVALGRSLEWFPKGDPQLPRATQLLRRCDEMIVLNSDFRAVLNGQTKPANANACLRFAQFCRIKEHYAAATAFAVDGFSREPSWMTEPYAGQRYSSACAAALAGSGRGQDAAGLTEADRQQMRGRAVDGGAKVRRRAGRVAD
jgi:hypothetical protein